MGEWKYPQNRRGTSGDDGLLRVRTGQVSRLWKNYKKRRGTNRGTLDVDKNASEKARDDIRRRIGSGSEIVQSALESMKTHALCNESLTNEAARMAILNSRPTLDFIRGLVMLWGDLLADRVSGSFTRVESQEHRLLKDRFDLRRTKVKEFADLDQSSHFFPRDHGERPARLFFWLLEKLM